MCKVHSKGEHVYLTESKCAYDMILQGLEVRVGEHEIHLQSQIDRVAFAVSALVLELLSDREKQSSQSIPLYNPIYDQVVFLWNFSKILLTMQIP